MRSENNDFQDRLRRLNPQNPNPKAILQEFSLEKINQDQPTKLLRKKLDFEDVFSKASLPVIYVITPTYARPVQEAKLTQLCNVFRHIPNLHWILIEDSDTKNEFSLNFPC